MHAARPRRPRSAQRKAPEPAPPEWAYRRLVGAVILRAVRDLHEPAWRYDAAHWLAHEGGEWALLLDLDVTKLKLCKDTKGQDQ